jgi:predicted HTH transcriptional regulator
MQTEGFDPTALAKVLFENLVQSFTLQMVPMSVAFGMLGLCVGLVSGLYYLSIKKKDHQLYGKMQMLQKSLPDLIAKGENEFVGFKTSLRHDYRQVQTDKNIESEVLRAVAGFLNSKGGILLIGVNDQCQILGLANDYWSLKKKNREGFQQRVVLLVSNAFGKNICSNIHVAFHELMEKDICTLYIEPSKYPIYLKEGNNTIFYLRTGNLTASLSTSETVNYLQNRNMKNST